MYFVFEKICAATQNLNSLNETTALGKTLIPRRLSIKSQVEGSCKNEKCCQDQVPLRQPSYHLIEMTRPDINRTTKYASFFKTGPTRPIKAFFGFTEDLRNSAFRLKPGGADCDHSTWKEEKGGIVSGSQVLGSSPHFHSRAFWASRALGRNSR